MKIRKLLAGFAGSILFAASAQAEIKIGVIYSATGPGASVGMPQQRPQVVEDAQAFMRRVAALQIERCTHCQDGRWRVVQTSTGDRAALAALWPRVAHACRGPPRAEP